MRSQLAPSSIKHFNVSERCDFGDLVKASFKYLECSQQPNQLWRKSYRIYYACTHFHFQNKPRNYQSNVIAFSSFLEKNRSPSSLQGFEIQNVFSQRLISYILKFIWKLIVIVSHLTILTNLKFNSTLTLTLKPTNMSLLNIFEIR